MDNRIHDAFDNVHAEEDLKENTRKYLSEHVYGQPVKKKLFPAKYAVCTALCLLALIFFGGYQFYTIPVAAISIDVNPSIELEVNRFDRVISVTAYNPDGEMIISQLHLKHLNYEEAITAILESGEMSGYLAAEALVDISVASQDEGRSSEMQQKISECAGHSYGNVNCHTQNSEDVKHAHEVGLSFGKYRAFQELQELDPTITAEDIKDMSMHQIREMIDACGNSHSEENVTETESHGHGHGHGAE